jgi:hypothetical protein
MATPKKPQTVMEQLVEVLRDIVTEPMSDQSSHTPTPADVRHARSAMHAPAPAPRKKKKVVKAKARPASKKKPVAKRKKAKVTVKKKKASR